MSVPLRMLYSFGVCYGQSTVACVRVVPASRQRRLKGLSRVRGNSHARFLEGWAGAIPPGYSTAVGFRFGAKPAQSETPVRAAAKRRPPGGGRSGRKMRSLRCIGSWFFCRLLILLQTELSTLYPKTGIIEWHEGRGFPAKSLCFGWGRQKLICWGFLRSYRARLASP